MVVLLLGGFVHSKLVRVWAQSGSVSGRTILSSCKDTGLARVSSTFFLANVTWKEERVQQIIKCIAVVIYKSIVESRIFVASILRTCWNINEAT